MREERLLERIRLRNKQPKIREGENSKKKIDSVLRHLYQILNTRQGGVMIAQHFGIPDIIDINHAFPESLRDIERSIRQTIMDFEPRLTSVRVKFLYDEEELLFLRFQISAQLKTQRDYMPVLFESKVNTDGQVTVQ